MIPFSWRGVWTRAARARSELSVSIAALRGETGFVVLDLETTGLNPKIDAMVSVAVVPFVHRTPGRPLVETLVNPGRSIPPASQAVHGITEEMVRAAVAAPEIVGDVLRACAGRIVVGHSIGFDLAIINRYARLAGFPLFTGPALDVGRLAQALHPGWGRPSLDELARRFGVPGDGRHTAGGDAVIAGHVLLVLLDVIEDRGAATVGDLLHIQRSLAGR